MAKNIEALALKGEADVRWEIINDIKELDNRIKDESMNAGAGATIIRDEVKQAIEIYRLKIKINENRYGLTFKEETEMLKSVIQSKGLNLSEYKL
jgi:hypothetical protein